MEAYSSDISIAAGSRELFSLLTNFFLHIETTHPCVQYQKIYTKVTGAAVPGEEEIKIKILNEGERKRPTENSLSDIEYNMI